MFYPTKEHLFYEVLCEYRKELILKCHSLLAKQTPLTNEYFADVLFLVMRESMDSCLFSVAKNNEFEYILRKLAAELIQKNESELTSISEVLLNFIPLFYSSVRKSKK